MIDVCISQDTVRSLLLQFLNQPEENIHQMGMPIDL